MALICLRIRMMQRRGWAMRIVLGPNCPSPQVSYNTNANQQPARRSPPFFPASSRPSASSGHSNAAIRTTSAARRRRVSSSSASSSWRAHRRSGTLLGRKYEAFLWILEGLREDPACRERVEASCYLATEPKVKPGGPGAGPESGLEHEPDQA